MTYFDRRAATENATAELAACYGRHNSRAMQEAANSIGEREPVEFDLGMADRVAQIMARLSRRP